MGEVRRAAAATGPGRAASDVKTDHRNPVRSVEEPARPAAELLSKGRSRSDRRDAAGHRAGNHYRLGAGAGGSAMTDKALAIVKPKPKEPLRQRLIRSLLYGRNVDRAAKARARVGFAMLAFVAIYAVIAG